MSDPDDNVPGVRIGDVHGDITGSQFAGRDIIRSNVSVGEKPAEGASFNETKQLLETILQEIKELSAHSSSLSSISAASPSRVQGALESVKASLSKVAPEATADDKKTAVREIAEAESSISHLLQNAKDVVTNASSLGKAAVPLLDYLSPLHAHLTEALRSLGTLWS